MLGERKESRALLAVMGTDEATIRAAALSNEEAPVRLGARPGLRTRAARSSEGRFPPFSWLSWPGDSLSNGHPVLIYGRPPLTGGDLSP